MAIPYCGTPPDPADLLERWQLDPVLIATLIFLLAAYLAAAKIPPRAKEEKPSEAAISRAESVKPDPHLDRAVSAERRVTAEDDLLNVHRPVE